jgi:hypothetical protein
MWYIFEMFKKPHWIGIGLVFLVAAGAVVYSLRNVGSSLYVYFDRHGHFHHDKVSDVSGDNWSETDCTNKNTKTSEDRPLLFCGTSENEMPKLLKVRFKGITHDKNQSDSTTFYWKCRRNQIGSDPAIECGPPNATWP